MSADLRTEQMAKTRALMTQTERDRIAGREDVEDIKRYQAITRVRRRIEDELTQDISILEDHHEGLLEELRDVVCDEGAEEVVEADLTPSPTHERTQDAVADEEGDGGDAGLFTEDEKAAELPDEISPEVVETVKNLTQSWEKDSRLENRRRAAATVLQYALDTGEGIGKSHDIVDRVIEEYPVEEQGRETYWRKNVRDKVLTELGEYSRSTHKYTVEGLEGDNA